MRRLNIDDQRIKSKNLINFGVDYLQSEKAKVKAELKKYDNDFLESFNRLPNRTEKEVMRPLYMYYKNLKNSIDLKNNLDSKSGGSGTYSRHNTSGSVKSSSSTSSKKQEVANMNNSNMAIMGTNNEVATNISDINISEINLSAYKSPKEDRRFTSPSSSTSSNQGKEIKEFSREKRSSSASSASSLISNTDSKGSDIVSFDDNAGGSFKKFYNISKDKKLSKNELIGFEKELDGIRKDQHALKQKLHAYQKEFYEVHNRRVKYYKDIIGIEYEYQKYKDNKNKIKELEEILAPYKKPK